MWIGIQLLAIRTEYLVSRDHPGSQRGRVRAQVEVICGKFPGLRGPQPPETTSATGLSLLFLHRLENPPFRDGAKVFGNEIPMTIGVKASCGEVAIEIQLGIFDC